MERRVTDLKPTEAGAGPASHAYFSQRLRLHYVDWGNPDAPPLLLVHGGRDHCRNWDWVAHALKDRYHIIAPDLRGHGDSQWMLGGAYRMSDYVYDIAQLVHQAMPEGPITIIGHSLGGSISLAYTGIYPEKVRKVIAIEGLGSSPRMIAERAKKQTYEKFQDWIEQLRTTAGRLPRRYPTLEAALQRMQEENKHLSPEQARHLTVHGVNRNEDGTYSWKFDNYVRVDRPFGLKTEDYHALWQRITCPTLLVYGSESWASDPEKDGRAAHFRNAEVVRVEGAGHWVHHDRLDVFLEHTRRFLAD